MAVRLSELAAELDRRGVMRRIVGDCDIDDVSIDSRAVGQGTLFGCVPGSTHDGHDFAAGAVRDGAVALLVTRGVGVDVPTIEVEATANRRAVAVAASMVHGNPSQSVPVVGITGTNGKTTTAAMLQSICEVAGLSPRVFGTLTGARTTAESTELQREMRRAVDSGRRIVIMEVTSHALELDRTHNVSFHTAVYTNLGHDHLDFHGSLDVYFAAKAKLFDEGVSANCVVNRDDAHGRILIDRITASGRGGSLSTYGLDDVADLRVSLAGSTFTWGGIDIVLPIGGTHNVYNALAAATAARVVGVGDAAIAEGLASLPGIPGRLQRVSVGAAFDVVVDYAHTPDSLRAVLESARATLKTDAKLVVVFGCGGDRDKTKRPEMGAVAHELADRVFVTNDNPRNEDPAVIAGEILSGMTAQGNVVVELDRRRAIAAAIGVAQPGDVVVIAGKGHESGQVVGSVTYAFDDAEEARRAVEAATGGPS